MMINSGLFIYSLNICRSPTAKAIFLETVRRRGRPVYEHSDGTVEWHLDKEPYELMQKSAAEFGWDLSPLRARHLVQKDFLNFNLIIAGDQQNLIA